MKETEVLHIGGKQPPEETGMKFSHCRIDGSGPWPFVETGCIYHKIDMSDVAEPYLSAIKLAGKE